MYFLEAFLVLIALCFITFWLIVIFTCRNERTIREAIKKTNLHNTNLYKITRPDGRTEIIKLDFNPGEDFKPGDKFDRISEFGG